MLKSMVVSPTRSSRSSKANSGATAQGPEEPVANASATIAVRPRDWLTGPGCIESICTQRGACGCHVALVSDMLARRQRGADGIACRRRGGEQLRCTLRLPLRGGNGCHVLQVADSA